MVKWLGKYTTLKALSLQSSADMIGPLRTMKAVILKLVLKLDTEQQSMYDKAAAKFASVHGHLTRILLQCIDLITTTLNLCSAMHVYEERKVLENALEYSKSLCLQMAAHLHDEWLPCDIGSTPESQCSYSLGLLVGSFKLFVAQCAPILFSLQELEAMEFDFDMLFTASVKSS
jgi:hypothetical protein